jgi:hypothetical protein
VTTDPGSGITHPGWFGVTPPGDCGGSSGPPPKKKPPDTETDESPVVLPLLTGESGDFPTLSFTEEQAPGSPPPPPGCPPDKPPDDNKQYLEVSIAVDGPLGDFMSSTGSQPLEDGTSFVVGPGETETVGATARSYADMFGGLQNIDTNILYGSKITITQEQHNSDGSTHSTVTPYYLYRLIDATDGNPNDGTISFEDALAKADVTRTKPLDVRAGAESQPTVSLSASSEDPNDFSVDQAGGSVTLEFSPADQLFGPSASKADTADLEITTPGGDPVPNAPRLAGNAYAPMNLDINSTDIVNALQAVGYGDPDTDTAIADSIIAKTGALFAEYGTGILVNGSYAGNTVTTDFSTRAPLVVRRDGELIKIDPPALPTDQVLGRVRGQDPAIDDIGKVSDLIGSLGQYNTQQENYLLAEALNQSTAPKQVEIYIGTFAGYDEPPDQLENDIAKTIAHEAGHAVGLVHTYSPLLGTQGGAFGGFGAAGQADIMSLLPDPEGTKTFDLTAPALTMGLKLNYTSDEAQTALSYYVQNFTMNGGQFFDASVEFPPPGLDQSRLPGPHLAIFSTQTKSLLGPGYAFGSVPLDPSGKSPATASFVLANYGSSNVELNGAGLSGSSAFAVSGMTAGQVLQPGETAQIQVTFDPPTAGNASATLHIASNDPNGPPDIALTGFGLSQAPSAQLTLANNDLGGVAVGAAAASPKLATITNDGVQPLTISSLQVEAGGTSFALTGVPADLATKPITLATGQSFTFGVQYTAGQVGLERAKIDVATNDPNQHTLTFGVVGTGLDKVVYPHWGNDYVAIEFPHLNSGATLRTVSDASGHFSFFLPADQAYHIAVFDPITGLIANGYGITPPSGQGLDLTTGLVFGPSTAKDTDGDGLPDDVEFAVGTSPTNAYTAGDGIDDFTHVIIDHTSPQKGPPLTTGVVATLPLNGQAEDVTLVGSPNNSQGQTAYVATGSYGLAIVNASNIQQPVLLGQLRLPGDSVGVAEDPQLQTAAVASTSALNLVDVSDPTHPALLQSISMPAGAVKVSQGIAYVAGGNDVTAIDLLTGQAVGTESFSGGNVDDLSIDQGNLYVLASEGAVSHTVYKVPLDPTGASLPEAAYSLTITGHPTFGRMHLFAGGGYVYVGAADNNNTQEVPGVEVLQDSGTSLALVGAPSAITAFDVTVNGNGLALFTGANQSLENRQVGLLDLYDPTQTDKVVTVFNTPGVANAIAIGEGIAFVADDSAGLAVLNFLPFDTKGVPPTATIAVPPGVDIDPGTPGIQVLEGSTIPVLATASDDVQVRNVELLVNGKVVQNAVSFPYNLSAALPTVAQNNGSSTVTLQVRATDTGGNVGLSSPLTLTLIPESSIPPHLVQTNVADGSINGQNFRALTFTFSKAMDPTTINANTFQLVGPDGTVAPTNFEFRNGNQTVQITYPTLPLGSYRLTVDDPSVKDIFGNPLGSAPVATHFSISPYSVTWVNPKGGNWSDPANWDTGHVPGASDNVLIDVPGNVAITYDKGNTTIQSLVSDNPLTITGGTLAVTGSIQVNNTFALAGGTLSGGVIQPGTGGQGLTLTSQGGTLDGVTTAADLATSSGANGANAYVTNGLTLQKATVRLGNAASGPYGLLIFQGDQTLGGSGTVLFGKTGNNSLFADYGTTLTIGPNITVAGSSGALGGYYTHSAIINRGKIAADDSGGQVPGFGDDQGFSGGFASSTADAIDASGVTDPAPQAVYQSYRYGPNFSYALAGLTANASYTIRLDFAEPYGIAAGQRVFDVTANGATALSSFDIFAAAGGPDKAVARTFTASADGRGAITLAFNEDSGSSYEPLVNGIQVLSGSSVVQAINCGDEPGGTLAVSPASFTNNGTVSASNGETLAINGAWTNAAGSTISATGATLDLGDQDASGANAWSNLGVLSATNSTTNLGGAFTLAALGTFNHSGGAVNLTGVLDARSSGLALNGTTGSWDLAGGTLKGGTYSASGGAGLVFTDRGGTLDGVTAASDLDLATNSFSYATVTDGLTLQNTTVRLGNAVGSNAGSLTFSGDQTLGGSGTVLFGKSGNNSLTAYFGTTLTIGPSVTVAGSSGALSGYYSNSAIINRGKIAADDSGGQVPGFSYDTGFSGGDANSTSDAIDASGVTDPAPQAVYQTYREGSNFTYALTGLTANASYTVRLDLADPDATAAGQRVFDVTANGATTLSSFDVFAAAGGPDKAVARTFTASADGRGAITLAFNEDSGSSYEPLVNGIQVLSGSSVVQAINCGDEPGGTLYVNPASFTNQGTLAASNDDNLSLSNFVSNTGTVSAGVGGAVTINADFSEDPAGTLAVALGGTGSGQFGTIAVKGAATLNGTLNVTLANGFTPASGDRFPVLTFDSSTGTFTTVHTPPLGGGLVFATKYDPTDVTLTVGPPQMSALPARAGGADLTAAQLQPIVQEAAALWAAAENNPALAQELKQVPIQIVHFGGPVIGLTAGDAIDLSADAAGYGWFVDAAPQDSSAFNPALADGVFQAAAGSPAAGQMDLLTVVAHEMGHILGLPDTADDGVMGESLLPGIRRLPEPAADPSVTDLVFTGLADRPLSSTGGPTS